MVQAVGRMMRSYGLGTLVVESGSVGPGSQHLGLDVSNLIEGCLRAPDTKPTSQRQDRCEL